MSLAFAIIVTLLALALAGCGGSAAETPTPVPDAGTIGTVPDSSSEATQAHQSTEGGPETPDEFIEWVHAGHAGSSWVLALSDVVYTQKLGSPVIELHLSGTADEVRAMAGPALGALRAGDPGLQAWVEVWDADGQVAGAGFGVPREREFPAAPVDVAGLEDWLATVYGPDGEVPGEAWHQAIEAIELGESVARMPVVRIATSLPVGEARSADHAALIVIAVSQAAPTFAEDVEVWYADAMGLLSGTTDAYDPYVY